LKLFYTANSPYARRPRLAVRAAGLEGRVEEVDVAPLGTPDHPLLAMGPGGKVPALLTDSGALLCETLLICQHLDDCSGGRLRPAGGPQREREMAIEGVASLLMDSLFQRSHEKRRADGERSQAVIDKETARARRCYDALDSHVVALADAPGLAAIAVACGLGYAEWRHPDDGWRDGRPALAAWFEAAVRIPGFAQTHPSG